MFLPSLQGWVESLRQSFDECELVRGSQNETLIAIKAPLGTTLEVPDPDEVIFRRDKDLMICRGCFNSV
jgi:hypothetical protein